jgi:hypothetical protein
MKPSRKNNRKERTNESSTKGRRNTAVKMRWFACRLAVVTFVVTLILGRESHVVGDASNDINNKININDNDNNKDASTELTVVVSPKCAAVLLVAGTTLGAGVASVAVTLTPAALCASGFCSTGVAAGSYAAWWQSTMPLVAKGSLFALLQSITTTASTAGAATGTILTGAAVGGAASAAYLHDFCVMVDKTDPESELGLVFDTCWFAAQKAGQTKEYLVNQCTESTTCTAISTAAVAAADSASSWWQSMASRVATTANNAAVRLSMASLRSDINHIKAEFGKQTYAEMDGNYEAWVEMTVQNFLQTKIKVGDLEMKLKELEDSLI